MITNKTMYQLYTANTKISLAKVEEEIKRIQEIREPLLQYFIDTNLPVDIDYEELKKGNETLLRNPVTSKEKYFNIQLKSFNTIQPVYAAKIEIKNNLLQHKTKENVFNFILNRFNELLVNAIIYEGYKFFDLWLGNLYVIYNKSSRPTINWDASNKNKKVLLEKGELPYNKADFELAKAEGKEYKGVRWLEYISDASLYFQWGIENAQFIRLPNIKNFTFIPYRGKTSPVTKLAAYKRSLSEEQLINFNTSTNANQICID